MALRLLENDPCTRHIERTPALTEALNDAWTILEESGITAETLTDVITSTLSKQAATVCRGVVTKRPTAHGDIDRRIDRVLTSRVFGYPLMIALLCAVFWLTLVFANTPSEWLSSGFSYVEAWLSEALLALGAPLWLHDALVLGVFRVLSWVIAVMLPPMAIFFPLFTLLEDVGYLPRVAYNLDHRFYRCHACGKQALTMAMGFGCNAAGVVGARIIDSKRERLLATLTNNFVPCNGRFPTLIAILTMFCIGGSGSSLLSTLLLTAVVLLGILLTFGTTALLSRTVLKGVPSSFTLELPPF